MRKAMALMLLMLLLLTSCAGVARPGDGPHSAPAAPQPAAQVDSRISTASIRFGIELLQQVYEGQNAFLSPLSASLVLSLTAGGARGETQDELWEALRFEGLTATEIHQGNQTLQSILANPDPKVEVAMANALWHRSDVAVAPAFERLVGDYYGAGVEGADFGTPAATQQINEWTAKATKGKIGRLLEAIKPNTVMILVNALYFKGAWSEAFDPQRTHEGPFITGSGTEKRLPFMAEDREVDYLEGAGFKAVRLPYGTGRTGMYLFVPEDLPSFVQGLTAEDWAHWMKGFGPRKGLIRVPKVKLEATHQLNEPMQRLGLVRAFDGGQADFSGLFADGRGGVAIDLILQKTFLEITEEGTEAAAATAVVMEESAPLPLFEANRPFLVAIQDDQTGSLLFLGTITDP